MKEKKDRERFSIKFNENDPAHDAVIRLLEKQGPHSKAQFIVNAVLHYINCSETPDAAVPWIADRAAIEEIVAEILGRAGAVKQSGHGTGVKKTHGRTGNSKTGTEKGRRADTERDRPSDIIIDRRYHVGVSGQLKSTGRDLFSALCLVFIQCQDKTVDNILQMADIRRIQIAFHNKWVA